MRQPDDRSTLKSASPLVEGDQALRTSELQHRLINQIIPAYSFAYLVGTDRSVALEWITPGVVDVIGYSAAELQGDVSFRSCIHPDDRATHQASLDQAVSGNPVTMDFRFLTKSGEERWLQSYSRAEWSAAENRVIRIVGATQDITDRKRAEESLRNETERLRLALGAARLGAWDWDFATNKVQSDDRLIAMFSGGTRKLSEEVEFKKFIHPEDVQAVDLAIQNAVTSGNQFDAIFRVIWMDGSIRWLEGHGSILRHDDGHPKGLIGVTADITEKKNSERLISIHAQLSRDLNHVDTVKQASRLIVGVADELMGWDCAVLMMFDENTGLCRAVLNIDIIDGQRCDVTSQINDEPPTPQMKKIVERGPELILRHDGTSPASGLRTFGDMGRRSASLLFVPIRDGKRTVGVLSIQSYKHNAYKQADLDKLQSLTDQCAATLFRIQSRERQNEIQERFAIASRTANIGHWEWNTATNYTLYSEVLLSHLGYVPGELEAHFETWKALLHPAEKNEAVQTVMDYVEGRSHEYKAELRMRHKNGDYRWIFAQGKLIKTAEHQPHRMVVCHLDITESKETKIKDAKIFSLLQTTVESSADGVLVVDLNNTVSLYNQRFVELWRIPKELLEKKDDLELARFVSAQLEDPDAFLAGVSEVYSRPEAETFDTLLFKDGRIFERYSRPQKIGDEIIGRVVSFRDVTERKRVEESARQSQQQFADLVNNVDGIVWEANAQTLAMSFVSYQAERILGYPLKDWLESKTFWQDHLHPEDRAGAVNYCREQTQLGKSQDFEYRMVAADGRVVWIRDLVMVNMKDGQPIGLRGIMVDVTQHKQAEQAMRATETQYKLLFESAPDAVFLIAADGEDRGRILAANPSAAEMHGYTISEMLAMNIADLDDAEATKDSGERMRRLADGESLAFEIKHRRKDGSLFPVEVRAGLMVVDNSKCILAFDRDITERKRVERLAEDATSRLQALSQRLIDFQETERRHLSRELHDEVGQTLTATKIILDSLRHQATPDPDGGTRQLTSEANRDALLLDATQHVDQMLKLIRNLSMNLRPPMLDDFGLVSAMRWLLDKHAQTSGRTVEFDEDYNVEHPDAAVETACFRIAQEAITNITRHSQAGKISVTLRAGAKGIKLLVSDDGVGFDVPAALQKARLGGSLGLLNMQERAGLVGGRLEVISNLGEGAIISARFPLASPPIKPAS